jgi:hypothetical protein
MEFAGFIGADFDFFRKKDKMTKEEYEKGRNNVKIHFRGLCYEIQKIYHTKTGGVFDLDKEFQNFNRRSKEIWAEHRDIENKCCIDLQLNGEFLSITQSLESKDLNELETIIAILTNKKNIIWQCLSSNKHMMIYAEFPQKAKKINSLQLSSLNISNKNYDAFVDFINDNKANEKYVSKVVIGYNFSKNECVKQGQNFKNTAYDAVINMLKLKEELYN